MTRTEELIFLRDREAPPAPTTPLERAVASVLDEAQGLLEMANREQKTDEGPVLASWLATLLQAAAPDAAIEYIAVVDPETLEFAERIGASALVALGASVEGERVADARVISRR